jgi:carbonic anhydrase
MEAWKRLLLENKAWAQDAGSHSNPADKRPEFLWIGSSDPLVSPERITGSDAGDLMVHRNLGNLVLHTDLNLLAVLEAGVAMLEVPHVIVCGHYGCLGVKAALEKKPRGVMNAWLNHIRDIARSHKDELSMHEPQGAFRRLVELNVMQQVHNLARTEVVQRAWKSGATPTLHGWVYDGRDYTIRPLCKVDASTPLDEVHQFEIEPVDD